MVVSIAAALSADAGNTLTFGSDNGLYAPVSAPRSGAYGVAIDNSWMAVGGAAYYPQPSWQGNATAMLGQGLLWPIVVTRKARISGATMWATSAGAASVTFFSVFSALAATGLPGNKITDALSFNSTVTGALNATVLDANAVLTAHTLYYGCAWTATTSGFPVLHHRSVPSTTNLIQPRTTPLPTTAFASSYPPFYADSSAGWSARTAAPAAIMAAPAAVLNVPHVILQLTNV